MIKTSVCQCGCDFTCETPMTPPRRGRGPIVAARPAGTGPAGSDPDGRPERWTPGRPPSSSRVVWTPLHCTPICARGYRDRKAENCLLILSENKEDMAALNGDVTTILGGGRRGGKERRGYKI